MDNFHKVTAAISSGGLQDLETLLSSKAVDPNEHYRKDLTALMYAAEFGSVESIRCLVQHKAYLNARDRTKETAVIKASRAGKSELLKTLVKLGAKVNFRNSRGQTALLFACERGDRDMVSSLVQAGSNVNACAKDYSTPLLKAVMSDCLEIVKYLVEHGAAVVTEDVSLLNVACHKTDVSMVRYLVSLGYDVNRQSKKEGSPLIVAADEGRLNIVKLLMKAGSNLETFYCERNALMVAARNGHLKVCQCLVDGGANVNAVNKYGATALISAAVGGHEDIVRLLLQAGAKIDHADENSETALIVGSYHGHENVVRCLVESGANIHQLTSTLDSVLTVAAAGMSSRVIKWWLQNLGMMPGLSIDESDIKKSRRVRKLCSTRDDGFKSFSSVKENMTATTFPDLNHQNNRGETALIISARLCDDSSVEYLLKAGANCSITNGIGMTALQSVPECQRFFGQRKQHLGDRDNDKVRSTIEQLIEFAGCTNKELHEAVLHNDYVVKTLVEHGAMPTIVCLQMAVFRWSSVQNFPEQMALTPFSVALLKGNMKAARYFALKLFFHEHDLKVFRRDPDFRLLLGPVKDGRSLTFFDEIFSEPWTLANLCFVVVSNALGFSPGRRSRVSRTGLPEMFQRRLLFNDEATNTPVSEWPAITLVHLHGRKLTG